MRAAPLVSAMIGGAALWLAAQEPSHNILTFEEKQAGWELLFDGESMTGWRDPSHLNPPGDAWAIEQGCLKANAHPRITEDLLTEQSYGDFELAWEWRISSGGNSGVKYRIQAMPILCRASRLPEKARFEATVDHALTTQFFDRSRIQPDERAQVYTVGLEYQLVDARHPDARRGPLYQAGSLYGMVARTRDVSHPIGEFNQSRLVVRGDHVEHWMNGEKVVDASLKDPESLKGLAKRWGTESPVYRLLAEEPQKKTPIGLQNHGDDAWFRTIRIRRLH